MVWREEREERRDRRGVIGESKSWIPRELPWDLGYGVKLLDLRDARSVILRPQGCALEYRCLLDLYHDDYGYYV